MKHTYRTKGTCSSVITFDLTDGILSGVTFTGGCNGNLKAISRLVEGKNAEEIMNLLRGNTCGPRSTSCADQLSRAIEEVLAG